MIIQSLVEGPAKSDGRLQPGDELVEVKGRSEVGLSLQEGVAIINTPTFKVRKRNGKTTFPATSPTKLSAIRKGEAVAMDTSLVRRMKLADVGRCLLKEKKQPLSVTDRTQFPAVMFRQR